MIACAGRRRNRQAGAGQPCRWGPCTVRGPSRTPRHPRGPRGAPHSPHGLLTASRAPKPRTTAGAGAVSSPRVTVPVPAFVPWALSVPWQCKDQRFYPMGFTTCRPPLRHKAGGIPRLMDLYQGKPSSGGAMLHTRGQSAQTAVALISPCCA